MCRVRPRNLLRRENAVVVSASSAQPIAAPPPVPVDGRRDLPVQSRIKVFISYMQASVRRAATALPEGNAGAKRSRTRRPGQYCSRAQAIGFRATIMAGSARQARSFAPGPGRACKSRHDSMDWNGMTHAYAVP